MKEKRRISVLVLLWLAVAVAGTIYALESVSFSVPFVMGKVDIRLEQYYLEEGQETEWYKEGSILPGQYISWIPRVYNDGEDCYIRARLTVFDAERQERKDLEEFLAAEMNAGWQKGSDGYWYYSKILGRGDSAELFHGIIIPKELPQEEWEERQVMCGIHVEAIQSQNIEPDLTADMPWGTVAILDYQKENETEIVYVEPVEKALRIIYLGEAEKWLTNGSELFSEVSCFMPGGIYCDELTVVNEHSQSLFLYMSGKVVKGPQWLEQIELTIRSRQGEEETILYEGTMSLSGGADKMLLQKIPGNGEGQLLFEIRVPESLDNRIDRELPQIEWSFYGQVDGKQDNENLGSSGNHSQTGGKVETGDTSALEWMLGSLSVSLLVIGCGVFAWRKGSERDE